MGASEHRSQIKKQLKLTSFFSDMLQTSNFITKIFRFDYIVFFCNRHLPRTQTYELPTAIRQATFCKNIYLRQKYSNFPEYSNLN